MMEVYCKRLFRVFDLNGRVAAKSVATRFNRNFIIFVIFSLGMTSVLYYIYFFTHDADIKQLSYSRYYI